MSEWWRDVEIERRKKVAGVVVRRSATTETTASIQEACRCWLSFVLVRSLLFAAAAATGTFVRPIDRSFFLPSLSDAVFP